MRTDRSEFVTIERGDAPGDYLRAPRYDIAEDYRGESIAYGVHVVEDGCDVAVHVGPRVTSIDFVTTTQPIPRRSGDDGVWRLTILTTPGALQRALYQALSKVICTVCAQSTTKEPKAPYWLIHIHVLSGARSCRTRPDPTLPTLSPLAHPRLTGATLTDPTFCQPTVSSTKHTFAT